MTRTYLRNAIVLGLVSAVGPFAIDMYIPALPAISTDLGATTAATQLTLTVFFVAFGVCQIIYGPVSDMVGRKPPLYVGLALFIAGSLGCAFAPDIAWLIAFRFLQGLGASAMMVIPRAIIRDLHTGVEATRLMSLVMLVFSVSPILAPLLGSALIVPFGWRAVFFAVTVTALLSLILLATLLPETRPPHERMPVRARDVLGGFAILFRDGHFLGLTLIGGLGMASFFAFLATSSFIYIDTYGLSPMQYGLTFGLNAIGFIGASQFSASLGERFGMARTVLVAVMAYAASAAVLAAATFAGFVSLPVLVALLFVTFAFLGLVIPATMVLSLEPHGPIAGIASALGGTLQMIAGGAVIALVSLVFDGTARPMVATILLCALGALATSLVTLRGRSTAPQLAE